MKSVLVLCMPEDYGRVRNVVGALNESDVDVYWDRTDPQSPEWSAAVERAAAARAVVFFLSDSITTPANIPFVQLAAQCIRSEKAVCVRIDSVELPPDLDGCTIYDLRGWRSRASSLFMLDLVAGVKAKAAGLDPPTPRAARQLLIQRLYIAVPSAIALIALFAGLYRDLGADQIASPAEAAAWQTIRAGSCDDLRAFLGQHGAGVHADEAQALLAARRTVQRNAAKVVARPLPLYISAIGAAARPGNGAATADARQRANAEAERLCRGLADASSSQLVSAQAAISATNCESMIGGSVCSAEGQAICNLEEPEVRTVEVCGSRS